MRLHRFYVNQELKVGGMVNVDSSELSHQIRRVFRLKASDEVVLFNGTQFDYLCKIDDSPEESIIVGNNNIRFQVISQERSRFLPEREVYLCAALVKKDTFEWITEKATELGVTHIVPVIAERSEKKSLNEDRLKKIVIEASEQSGRGSIPMVQPIMGVKDAIGFIKGKKEKSLPAQSGKEAKIIAFHTDGKLFERGSVESDKPLALFIGPEGGWSPKEIEVFHKNNIEVLSLGNQVLRAGTAAIAALSVVMLGK